MRYNHGDVSLVMCCALQSHETVGAMAGVLCYY